MGLRVRIIEGNMHGRRTGNRVVLIDAAVTSHNERVSMRTCQL